MAIKSQTVAQYAGFGNDKPKSLSEFYFGKGVVNDADGLRVGMCLSNFFNNTTIPAAGSIRKIVKGRGRSLLTDVEGDYVFFGSESNNIILQAAGGILTPEVIYRILGQTWSGIGMAVDQNKRLLYSGQRYLGKHDATVANYSTGTVSVTNGSAAVVGSGTTFVAGDVGKVFRLTTLSGTTDFYRISAFTDATHITLSSNYAGTTNGSAAYAIYRGWDDTWKDWGTSISNMSDGTALQSPTERYEDTVLFGRKNNIVSLNSVTDTITDDTTPAFNMPAGYDNIAIKANTNGILMGFNFQGRGTLVLWDNYSDRSIAPWIPLDDLLLAIQRYGSGWIVMTKKSIYFTNGYSIEPFISEFMESSVTAWTGVTQDAFMIIGDYLYFGFSGTFARTRGGLYRINLKTKLAEYFANETDILSSASVAALYYSPDFTAIYISDSVRVSFLSTSGISSSRTYYYISENVGLGENPKVAEQIRLPIEVSKYTSSKVVLTFTIECRVNNLDRQLHNQAQVKSNSANATTMTVDETTWPAAQVGDIVEFVSGNNQGLIRGITAISGGGTNAAVYTFDSALTSNPAISEYFISSGFKPVEKKVITATSELFDLYFGIKNKYTGKHFKVMFIITAATVALRLLPFEFQYDDMGALE